MICLHDRDACATSFSCGKSLRHPIVTSLSTGKAQPRTQLLYGDLARRLAFGCAAPALPCRKPGHFKELRERRYVAWHRPPRALVKPVKRSTPRGLRRSSRSQSTASPPSAPYRHSPMPSIGSLRSRWPIWHGPHQCGREWRPAMPFRRRYRRAAIARRRAGL